jgi:uncharacterized protein (TIGR04145 family)
MKSKFFQFILSIFAILAVFIPVSGHADNKYGIVIDGKFDDWSGLPMTKLSYSYENGQNIKYASLVTDDSNLYFYLSMAPEKDEGYKNLQPSGHKLVIGNKVFWMTIVDPLQSGDSSLIGQTKDVSVTFWAEDNSVNVTLPIGKMTRVKTDFNDASYSDEVEIAVPFEQLQLEATGSQTIVYSNTNLDEQTITVTGGSTGPWLLAGIAVVIAGFSYWKLKGKSSSKTKAA